MAHSLDLARLTGSKLDRLSRNAAFLLRRRDSGSEFPVVDMPDANSGTVSIMTVIAEEARTQPLSLSSSPFAFYVFSADC